MTDTKVCPYCREDIKIDAIKCKYCQSMLNKEDGESERTHEPARTDPTVEYLRERDKKKESDKGIASLITFVIIVGLGIYLFSPFLFTSEEEPIEEPIEAESTEHAYSLFEGDLVSEYRENEVAADNKYKGKIIETWGTVDRITAATFSDESIIYLASGLRLSIADGYEEKVMELKPGDEIRVKGECTGETLGTVSLRNVIFIE